MVSCQENSDIAKKLFNLYGKIFLLQIEFILQLLMSFKGFFRHLAGSLAIKAQFTLITVISTEFQCKECLELFEKMYFYAEYNPESV